ncbi:hypothetical protein LCGC14_0519270 [marine sediment metagenome]|uniref:Uncharacterized protein n=1 Tax=marine sediment metagenome TaxID=412755 RepID=A0A0F9UKG7_9ZZZZ
MSSASVELAEYLEDEGVGTVGTDIFVDKQPLGAVNSLLIVTYPGAPPEHRMDGTSDVRFTFPNVQVRVRNTDDATAVAKANAAARALGKVANQTIEGTYYRSVNLIQQPGLIERDENDRMIQGFSAQAERQAIL